MFVFESGVNNDDLTMSLRIAAPNWQESARALWGAAVAMAGPGGNPGFAQELADNADRLWDEHCYRIPKPAMAGAAHAAIHHSWGHRLEVENELQAIALATTGKRIAPGIAESIVADLLDKSNRPAGIGVAGW